MYLKYVTDRKTEGKRFDQMVAKWLNRNVFGWGPLHLATRMRAYCCCWYARMSWGGLWDDYAARRMRAKIS